MKMIDLHTHSNISDGSCTPEELIERAKAAGLSALALTDHDTIDGLARAQAAARTAGVDFIKGMEMTVSHQGRRLHILALDFDETNAAFQAAYHKMRRIKERDIDAVISHINARGASDGIRLSREDVRPFGNAGIIDSYAILRYLISLGRFSAVQDIWDEYLNPALAEFNENLAAEEWIQAVKQAGGVTSLAHYHKRRGFGGLPRREQEDMIVQLLNAGLTGMEEFYSSYSADDARFAKYLIDKYKMLPTGGTDFHGDNRPRIALGTGYTGNLAIPYQIYENLVNR